MSKNPLIKKIPYTIIPAHYSVTMCFDMDGTIVDFYSVPNWKDYLDKESTKPYDIANPIIDINKLRDYLAACKRAGIKLEIISWTSKGGSPEYNKRVREAKVKWLKKYKLYHLFDSIHIVKYGTSKHMIARKRIKGKNYKEGKWIIYDDDDNVRRDWSINKCIKYCPYNEFHARSHNELKKLTSIF